MLELLTVSGSQAGLTELVGLEHIILFWYHGGKFCCKWKVLLQNGVVETGIGKDVLQDCSDCIIAEVWGRNQNFRKQRRNIVPLYRAFQVFLPLFRGFVTVPFPNHCCMAFRLLLLCRSLALTSPWAPALLPQSGLLDLVLYQINSLG